MPVTLYYKSPVLGVLRIFDKDVVVADIPGLIDGAHEGKGLGDKFLRHIERTKVLLHLIDAAAVDGRDPVLDYAAVNKELRLYSAALTEKRQLIAANKMDLPQAKKNSERLEKEIKEKFILYQR